MIESIKHTFKPGAMSIIQMGEELIGHPSTAINELVKNGYDADAGKCWVYTNYNVDKDKTFLIIKDNGLGMERKTLFGDWLKPSISSKRDIDKEKRKSKIFNRSYLGSKGIGRLAAMALGRHLTVITKTDFEDKYNWLQIDREQFRSDDLLNKIEFPGGSIKDYTDLFKDEKVLKSKNLKKNNSLINLITQEPFGHFIEGTTIIIEDLDDSVSSIIEEEFESVNLQETSVFKSLRDLITPLKLNSRIQDELVKENIIDKQHNIASGESTFELFYGINFLGENNDNFISIEPSKILDHFDYRVFGKVLGNGSVAGKYLCNRLEIDIRNEAFDLPPSSTLGKENEKIRKIDIMDSELKKSPKVGEFYFDFRIYDLDDDSKAKMVRLLNSKGRREANQIFGKYLGIKVSKNGFGVKPYGEQGYDWLGLGAKRVSQHIVSIGPNQIIGNTFLYSPQNDELKEKTNREGFFENRAFLDFKLILGGILSEIGRKRARYRAQHNLGRRTRSKLERPDTERFIQYILNESTNPKIIEQAKDFVKETNSALDNMEESLSFSQRLASIGSGLELVYHELAQPITSLGATKKSLSTNAKKVTDDTLKNILLDRIENLSTSITMLNDLKESLQPAIGKSLPKTFKPFDTFKKVCYLFENTFTEDGIELIINANTSTVEIKSFEYVFWISFLNIINNAVYWLKEGDKKRIISFEYDSDNGVFVLSNSGPMIPEEDIDIIFDYGITGKKEKNATGLGLAFTKNLLNSKGWDIYAENRSYGPAFIIMND